MATPGFGQRELPSEPRLLFPGPFKDSFSSWSGWRTHATWAEQAALTNGEFSQRSDLATLQSYLRCCKNSYFSSVCLNNVLALVWDGRPGSDATLHGGPGPGRACLPPLQLHSRSSSSQHD